MHFRYPSIVAAAIALASSWAVAQDTAPPRIDYCKMLERDIQGQHYGFIAGNTMYYVAGSFGAYWHENWESETIGFTHPIFRDGRARGHGIVTAQPGGTGHDYGGWEFWRQTRCAYGTVLLDGQTYRHPKPTSLIWRPDRHVATYAVGPATVTEQKFISEQDVLTSIITADRDMQIRFEGKSLFFGGKTSVSDVDPQPRRITERCDSVAIFREKDNVLDLEEKGAAWVKALRDEPVMKGRMRYDGMSFLLSSDVPLEDVEIEKQEDGPVTYAFTLSLKANQPAVLAHAAADEYKDAHGRIRQLLADPDAALRSKTDSFNKLLNEQIPFFRCSDRLVVKTYYYLWSLYFMYFIDVERGWEHYPHTQTAINNFMGLHLWDSWAYIQAGSWVADKWKWGHGNALQWQFMVPFKNRANMLPDNFGIAWYSPQTHMVFTGAVEPAWEQYRRSGDRRYLSEVYGRLFKPLYWDGNGPTPSFGIDVNALDTLAKMARELGEESDVEHWMSMRPKKVKAFESKWSGRWQGFYGGSGTPWKDIWALEALQSAAMPNDWAREMVGKFVMDTEQGFLSPVGVNTRAADSPPNGIFRCSTISSWLAIDGMFRQGCDTAGMLVTLNHLNGMTREWGYPVAPEAWEENHKAWGSRYYNWDIAIVFPMLEWLAGIDYSIPESRFSLKPHLPPTWDFIETRTPVVLEDQTHWVKARVERKPGMFGYELVGEIEGSPLAQNVVELYPEDRKVRTSRTRTTDTGATATLRLSKKKQTPYKTLAWVTPRTRIFHKEATVRAENLTPGTILRYTTDGREPTDKSPLFPEAGLEIAKTTALTFKAFGADGATYLPFELTFEDTELLPAAKVNASELEVGLDYVAYEIPPKTSHIPDFKRLKEIGRGSIGQRDLVKGIQLKAVQEEIGRKEYFALHISGYIDVPEDEVYNLHVSSDDGSRLYIDGQLVIDLDVACGVDPWIKEGFVGLRKGLHRVDIHYYQAHSRTKLLYELRTGKEAVRKSVSAEAWRRKIPGRP